MVKANSSKHTHDADGAEYTRTSGISSTMLEYFVTGCGTEKTLESTAWGLAP
jgi:hypothetical protein